MHVGIQSFLVSLSSTCLPLTVSPIDFSTSDMNEHPSGSATKGLNVINVRCRTSVSHYHIAATISYLSGEGKMEEVQSSPMALHVDQHVPHRCGITCWSKVGSRIPRQCLSRNLDTIEQAWQVTRGARSLKSQRADPCQSSW